MTVRTEETIRATEQAAEAYTKRAAELATAVTELTAVRDRVLADVAEVDRQAAWWSHRSPDHPAATAIGEAAAQLHEGLRQAEENLTSAAREQQTAEQVAADLTDRAKADRAEWDARHTPRGGTPLPKVVEPIPPGADITREDEAQA